MNTALEYSTRVVQEGGRRCKKSTLNDLVHLTPLRIPLMTPPVISIAGCQERGAPWPLHCEVRLLPASLAGYLESRAPGQLWGPLTTCQPGRLLGEWSLIDSCKVRLLPASLAGCANCKVRLLPASCQERGEFLQLCPLTTCQPGRLSGEWSPLTAVRSANYLPAWPAVELEVYWRQ